MRDEKSSMTRAPTPAAGSPRTELAEALRSCRTSYVGVAVFTAILNVLYLTGSFFMLQVYDRVLPSRSIPTLVALCILALGLYGFQAVLDIVRNRVLIRIAGGFAETLDRRVYQLAGQTAAPGTPDERVRAGPRPRPDQGLHVRHRPRRPVRPALDAALSRHLLPVPSAARPDGHGRRAHSGRHHLHHRGQGPPAVDRGVVPLRAGATASPKPAAATPRSCMPWAWSGGSPTIGRTMDVVTSMPTSGRATSPAAWAASRARCAWRCSPPCWRSVPTS